MRREPLSYRWLVHPPVDSSSYKPHLEGFFCRHILILYFLEKSSESDFLSFLVSEGFSVFFHSVVNMFLYTAFVLINS